MHAPERSFYLRSILLLPPQCSCSCAGHLKYCQHLLTKGSRSRSRAIYHTEAASLRTENGFISFSLSLEERVQIVYLALAMLTVHGTNPCDKEPIRFRCDGIQTCVTVFCSLNSAYTVCSTIQTAVYFRAPLRFFASRKKGNGILSSVVHLRILKRLAAAWQLLTNLIIRFSFPWNSRWFAVSNFIDPTPRFNCACHATN